MATGTTAPTSEAVATLAHELRTPITAVMATVSVLVAELDQLDREQTSSLLRRLERSTIWLNGLIENMVSTVALDTGSVRLERLAISVESCLEQVLPVVQPLLERKEQRLRVAPAAADAELFVDP